MTYRVEAIKNGLDNLPISSSQAPRLMLIEYGKYQTKEFIPDTVPLSSSLTKLIIIACCIGTVIFIKKLLMKYKVLAIKKVGLNGRRNRNRIEEYWDNIMELIKPILQTKKERKD
ncbi:MAG: hypothetical protein NZ922_01145 [Candidatus Methanomethyliaceae archaeon]|nr:hypothetical protein [Candidatus Methanomethyliaceae archaeon]MDW7971461.1 hypothetical protein [Nitrososphaerota archaeon]